MLPDVTQVYIPFMSKSDDTQRIVEGYISSGDIDCDDQIVDQEWLKGQLPSWLSSWGNIREMHTQRAVGKAQTVDLHAQPGPYLAAKIIDEDAWKKVHAGVYNGFSIGIKGPKIVYDGTAKKGRINGGNLVEISIVDRPANDAARFVLVKRAGANEWRLGEHGPVLEDVVKATNAATAPTIVCLPCGCGPDGAMDGCACDCVICVAARSADMAGDAMKAVWTTKEQNDLPDSSFAFIEDGGTKDGSGKTVPRAKRHFPYKDADGKPDPAHVRNALARIPQSTLPQEDKDEATTRVRAAADELGIGEDATKAATSHVEHRHPFKGVHNHAHDDLRGGVHTHAHLHNDDDMHEHPHLLATDARLLSPEDRNSALAMQRYGDTRLLSSEPDSTKAAVGFQDAAPATVSRPGSTLAAVRAMLQDAAVKLEALADQTDDDRDGDIDFPADDDRAPVAPADADVQRPDPTLVRPAPLSLTFATEADFHKAIDTRVQRLLETHDRDYITKAQGADTLAAIPDIAKLASGIATGLSALAERTKATSEDLVATKALLAETKEDLESVKKLAAPVKGAVFAFEKGIGLDTDRIYRDGAVPDSAARNGEAYRLASAVSEEDRLNAGVNKVADMYRSRSAQ